MPEEIQGPKADITPNLETTSSVKPKGIDDYKARGIVPASDIKIRDNANLMLQKGWGSFSESRDPAMIHLREVIAPGKTTQEKREMLEAEVILRNNLINQTLNNFRLRISLRAILKGRKGEESLTPEFKNILDTWRGKGWSLEQIVNNLEWAEEARIKDQQEREEFAAVIAKHFEVEDQLRETKNSSVEIEKEEMRKTRLKLAYEEIKASGEIPKGDFGRYRATREIKHTGTGHIYFSEDGAFVMKRDLPNSNKIYRETTALEKATLAAVRVGREIPAGGLPLLVAKGSDIEGFVMEQIQGLSLENIDLNELTPDKFSIFARAGLLYDLIEAYNVTGVPHGDLLSPSLRPGVFTGNLGNLIQEASGRIRMIDYGQQSTSNRKDAEITMGMELQDMVEFLLMGKPFHNIIQNKISSIPTNPELKKDGEVFLRNLDYFLKQAEQKRKIQGLNDNQVALNPIEFLRGISPWFVFKKGAMLQPAA